MKYLNSVTPKKLETITFICFAIGFIVFFTYGSCRQLVLFGGSDFGIAAGGYVLALMLALQLLPLFSLILIAIAIFWQLLQKKYIEAVRTLFTLFILLICASVLLSMNNEARYRGPVASLKANIMSARVHAEIYFRENQSYGLATNCQAPDSVFSDERIRASLEQASGGSSRERFDGCRDKDYLNFQGLDCFAGGESFAISASYNDTEHWCTDSSGFTGDIDTPITGPSCN